MAENQEHLTGNLRIRYPFADDSVLSVEEDVALSVFGCFVDALVQLKDPDAPMPVVAGLSYSGGALAFELRESADAETGERFTCAGGKTGFPVISRETSWCWCTFVMSAPGIRDLQDSASLLAPGSAVQGDVLRFGQRCIGKPAGQVRSIKVYGGEKGPEGELRRYTRREALEHEPDATVTGAVTLSTGHNMSFQDAAYSAFGNSITLNAVPGAGLGRFPCECQDAVTYKTPGLLSGDGHTRLFNDTCYDVLPMWYSGEYGELRLHVKCKACCTCEMYASIVEDRLVPLKDEVLRDKASLDSTLATYVKNVHKWNQRLKTALPEDIVITASAVPLDAAGTDLKGGDVYGLMNRCGFSVTVRNESFVTVNATLSDFSSNGDPFEAQVSYMDGDKKPVVRTIRPPINTGHISLPPGRSMTFTCFVRLRNMVRTDSQSGFMASARVSVGHNGRTVVSKTMGVSI